LVHFELPDGFVPEQRAFTDKMNNSVKRFTTKYAANCIDGAIFSPMKNSLTSKINTKTEVDE
jgi:hypothetical protein